MSRRLFAVTCGRLRCDLGRLMEGGEGQVELPVPAYLIEHPQGTALFDTGMHPDCQRNPAGRLGARLAKLFAFDYRPGEDDRGEVVLAADACYFCRTLRERRLPRFAHDREAMRASLDRLEAGGARIFFGHDPEFWKGVPQAPAPIG
jgi:glyoxylase-like metal-dependent hydrolase (beta-lactamase superfamily II)